MLWLCDVAYRILTFGCGFGTSDDYRSSPLGNAFGIAEFLKKVRGLLTDPPS